MSKQEIIYGEKCLHCRHNPNAQKPFKKMKHIFFDDETLKLLAESGGASGLKPDCVLCKSIDKFVSEWKHRSQA